jgi:hypothetical protein
MRYETPADVQLRLDKSILRLKGGVVYAQAVPDKVMLAAQFLHSPEKVEYVDPNDDSLDITTPPMGNVLLRGENCHLAFWYRVPSRTHKQGLEDRNTRHRYYLANGCQHASGMPKKPSPTLWEKLRPVADCIEGKYPTVEECLELLKLKSTYGVAWNRKAGVVRLHGVSLLVYDGVLVGRYNPKDNVATLHPRFARPSVKEEFGKAMEVKNV